MTIKAYPSILSLLVLAITSAAGFANAQTPDPRQVHIKKITYAGSGCASRTQVNGKISSDAKAFTLLFDNYYAEIGPGIPAGNKSSTCKLTVDLQFPNGWSYTLFKVDFRGYASLDQGVTALHQSKYYFQASPGNNARFQRNFHGSYDNNYLLSDTIALQDTTWSPCGRTRALNIETDISLTNSANPRGQGLITVDSMDGNLAHVYGIRWVRCN